MLATWEWLSQMLHVLFFLPADKWNMHVQGEMWVNIPYKEAFGYLKICCFKLFFNVHPDPLGWKIQLDEDILQIGFVQEPTSYVEYTLARRSKTHMSRCICHLCTTRRFRFPWFFFWFWEFLDPYKASLKGVRLTFQLVFLVNFGNPKLPETKTSLWKWPVLGGFFPLTNGGRKFGKNSMAFPVWPAWPWLIYPYTNTVLWSAPKNVITSTRPLKRRSEMRTKLGQVGCYTSRELWSKSPSLPGAIQTGPLPRGRWGAFVRDEWTKSGMKTRFFWVEEELFCWIFKLVYILFFWIGKISSDTVVFFAPET